MTLYEIVETQPLPRFDPTRMVKHALLSPATARRVSQLLRAYSPHITLSYFIGTLLFPVVLLARSSVAQYVAPVETVLELPVYAMVFLSLRADLVALVVESYDYWFFSIVTLVFSCTFSLLWRDARAVLMASRWFGFQVPILIDANVVHTRALMKSMLVNLMLAAFGLVAVALDLVPDTSDDTTWQTQPPPPVDGSQAPTVLSVRDLLVNALVTMGILLVRIVIRKRELTRSSGTTAGHPSPLPSRSQQVDPEKKSAMASATASATAVASVPCVVKCVTLRCSIKLQAVVAPRAILRTTQHQPSDQEHESVALRFVATDTQYDSEDTVLAAMFQTTILRAPHLVVFHGVGVMGLLFTLACWYISSSWSPLVVSVCALACTGSYLCTLLLFYNRVLLRQVTRSFDFVFLSLQLIMAHVCVADMLQYQLAPSAALICMVLWLHGILTLDALLPDMKQRLGFYYQLRWGVVAVLVLYLAGQCALVIQGILLRDWQLRDRVFLDLHLLGYRLEFRVLPFFASRMMTVSVWTLRLLWRVAWQHDPHALIMLRGQVEFEYERSRPSPITSFTSVAPATPPAMPTAMPASTKSVRAAHNCPPV